MTIYPGNPIPAPATDLAEYSTIKRFPARGGEADIFLVQKLDRTYILKLYRLGIQPKIEVMDRIISLSKSHPDYFAQVLNRGHDQKSKRFFEIEEYIEHGNLQETINQRRLSEQEIMAIFSSLAEALAILHGNGFAGKNESMKTFSGSLIRSLLPG